MVKFFHIHIITLGTMTSGAGGNGTSYSGGTGGGSNLVMSTGFSTYREINGGLNGGKGGISTSGSSEYLCYGGVGNPGGIEIVNYSKDILEAKGNNGTGGLLIISANSINNNGNITANGIGNGRHFAGGSSGGGSINIFYKNAFINKNSDSIVANGGISVNYTKYGKAGNGGNGSVTIGNILTGTFIKD